MSYRPTKGKGAGLRWIQEHLNHKGDDCLPWPFGKSGGYGTVSINGRIHWVHRYICELVHGPAPGPDYEAAHSCGKGREACANRKHISWKTPSENQLDRRKHGTRNIWSQRGRLTFEKAAEIRALRGKKSQDEIAAIYGVTRSTISGIMTGRVWTRRPKGIQQVGRRWVAQIKINKRAIYLGSYDTAEQARAVYLAASERAREACP